MQDKQEGAKQSVNKVPIDAKWGEAALYLDPEDLNKNLRRV